MPLADGDEYYDWYRLVTDPGEPGICGITIDGTIFLHFPVVVIKEAYTAVARMNAALATERGRQAPDNVLTPEKLGNIKFSEVVPESPKDAVVDLKLTATIKYGVLEALREHDAKKEEETRRQSDRMHSAEHNDRSCRRCQDGYREMYDSDECRCGRGTPHSWSKHPSPTMEVAL